MSTSAFEFAELRRVLMNLFTIGTVSEVDESGAKVKVRIEDAETDFIPVRALRAGKDVVSLPLEIGEQVLVATPFGDFGQAFVICSLYSRNARPQGLTARAVFEDGTTIEYDKSNHSLNIDVKGDGAKISLTVAGDVALTATGKVSLKARELDLCGAEFGVVTTSSICHFTGSPHGHGSTSVRVGM